MSEQVITQDMLSRVVNNTQVQGVCLLKSYQMMLTKNSKEYMQGTIMAGKEMEFKAWDSSDAFKSLKAENYNGVVVFIKATGNEYNGSMSLILQSVQAVSGFTVDQFLPEKYAIEAYWNALQTFMRDRVSEKGYNLLNIILFQNEPVAARFKLEFAAAKMHDNCKGGLLAHTYKVLTFVGAMLSTYGGITKGNKDFIDITLIGAVLHDLGKISEMMIGTYNPISVCTHPYLGAELLFPYKEQIVAAYDEQWYYTLMSIITEHHGQFGEPCRTIPSYIIHTADMLDSRMTLVQQKLEDVTDVQQVVISVDDFKLRWH